MLIRGEGGGGDKGDGGGDGKEYGVMKSQNREEGRKTKEANGCKGVRSGGRIERTNVPLTAGSL